MRGVVSPVVALVVVVACAGVVVVGVSVAVSVGMGLGVSLGVDLGLDAVMRRHARLHGGDGDGDGDAGERLRGTPSARAGSRKRLLPTLDEYNRMPMHLPPPKGGYCNSMLTLANAASRARLARRPLLLWGAWRDFVERKMDARRFLDGLAQWNVTVLVDDADALAVEAEEEPRAPRSEALDLNTELECASRAHLSTLAQLMRPPPEARMAAEAIMSELAKGDATVAVSYTHLTLPTIA